MTSGQRLVVAVLLVGLGALVGAGWMYLHLTCPACQSRWAMVRRWLGLRLIE
jgi:hypothetical protein